jgi:hypothetical protein
MHRVPWCRIARLRENHEMNTRWTQNGPGNGCGRWRRSSAPGIAGSIGCASPVRFVADLRGHASPTPQERTRRLPSPSTRAWTRVTRLVRRIGPPDDPGERPCPAASATGCSANAVVRAHFVSISCSFRGSPRRRAAAVGTTVSYPASAATGAAFHVRCAFNWRCARRRPFPCTASFTQAASRTRRHGSGTRAALPGPTQV